MVFIIEILIMNVQVKKEEQRLKKDFGNDYLAYVKNSNRFLPKMWVVIGKGNVELLIIAFSKDLYE